jgi:hypothetical protein
VADDYQSEIRVGQPLVPPRKSYFGLFGSLAALVIIAAAAVLLWMNYDHLAEVLHGGAASPQAMGIDDASDLAKEFRAFQQQTTESIGSTMQLLEAQQSELKALTSEIADLSAKIDKIVPVAVSPPQAPPPAAQPQPALQRAAPPSVAPARAAPVAPRKRAAAPKPEGAISVGGAPLPGTGAPGR